MALRLFQDCFLLDDNLADRQTLATHHFFLELTVNTQKYLYEVHEILHFTGVTRLILATTVL